MTLQTIAWERLHEVRLRGMVEAPDDGETAAVVEAGYVVRRGPVLAITPAGKAVDAERSRLAPSSEEEAAARRAYERFLEFDKQVKQLTTEWQMAAHSRADGYSADDWKVIDRLTAVQDRAGAVLLALGKEVPRFAGYRPRLRNALQRLEDGAGEWLSGLKCDSYHTVWWQLHEDLLVALGIDRSDDPNQ